MARWNREMLAVLAVLLSLAFPGACLATAPAVSIEGNRLVDADGQTLQLRGVNRSGTEYACSEGWSIFDGPSYSRPNLSQPRSIVAGMQDWGVNAVRVPLNEQCWLGINGVSRRLGGSAYRRAIGRWVGQLSAAGMVVILDLHVAGPGGVLAAPTLIPMADADHAPDFWRSVARTFKDGRNVIFDLFNEPHLVGLGDGRDESSRRHWACWRDGCRIPAADGVSAYQAAGMQQLVDAVRSTGARNVIMAGGLSWAGNLSRWNQFAPHDPAGQLAASFHNYPEPLGTCESAGCWAKQTRGHVTITGELGESDCAHSYVDRYMDWADGHRVSYLAWTWNATDNGSWDCSAGPALLMRYDGTPTPFGVGVRDHFRARASG